MEEQREEREKIHRTGSKLRTRSLANACSTNESQRKWVGEGHPRPGETSDSRAGEGAEQGERGCRAHVVFELPRTHSSSW